MEKMKVHVNGKVIVSLVMTIFLIAGFFVVSASAKEIVLKGYYIWGKRWESNEAYFKWAEMVNEFGKGLVRIQFVGGPETIPSLDALDYLRRGAIDVMNTAMGYHSGVVPEGEAISMWYGPPWVERESGFIDLLDKIYRKKVGLTLLGRAQTGGAVCLFSRKPVDKLDLTGLKFRSLKAYDPVVKMLGGTVQMISAEEVYSALERGVVDGMGWSGVGTTWV